jgi:hypothetical protein
VVVVVSCFFFFFFLIFLGCVLIVISINMCCRQIEKENEHRVFLFGKCCLDRPQKAFFALVILLICHCLSIILYFSTHLSCLLFLIFAL